MSEKVLGFRVEEADCFWYSILKNFDRGKPSKTKVNPKESYLIEKSKLVPVVLASESVELARHNRIIKALNKAHLKDTAFLIKLRANERRKVEKLEKELAAVRRRANASNQAGVGAVHGTARARYARKEREEGLSEYAAEMFGVGGKPTKAEMKAILKKLGRAKEGAK